MSGQGSGGPQLAAPATGCQACGGCTAACTGVSAGVSAGAGTEARFGAPPAGATVPDAGARIGPNALIQTARALEARLGFAEAHRLLGLAGMGGLAEADPQGMQDEREFLRLVTFLERTLGSPEVSAVLYDAGLRTGTYVLAHRIPGGVRMGLRVLPRGVRLRLTLSAMARHAWTFAGSSTFGVETGSTAVLRLLHGPGARTVPDPMPLHAFYRGAFEVLLRGMVAPGTELDEGVPPGRLPREGVDFRIRFGTDAPSPPEPPASSFSRRHPAPPSTRSSSTAPSRS